MHAEPHPLDRQRNLDHHFLAGDTVPAALLSDPTPAPTASGTNWYLKLLDRRADPCWLLDRQGHVMSANRPALQAMAMADTGTHLGHLLASGDGSARVNAALAQDKYRLPLTVQMLDKAWRPVAGRLRLEPAVGAPCGAQYLAWFFADAASADYLPVQPVLETPQPAAPVASAAPIEQQAFRHLSHELRTPLSAILGFSELLSRGLAQAADGDHGRNIGHLGRIIDAARHMLQITDDLLNPKAMVDAATPAPVPVQPVAVQPVGVAELFDAASALAYEQLLRHDVKLVTAPTARHLHVAGDTRRCKQVLCNLLSNAAKYGGAGGQVMLSARALAGWVRIHVRDHGPGLDEQQRARLFREHERLDAAQGPIEGHGLGLFISRQLVLAMGGRIGCDSIPGAGADFWFELPITTAA